MRGRTRYEHEARAALIAEGWTCIRSAGSRGPMDLIAFDDAQVRLIQVKSTRRLGHDGTLTMLARAVEDLLAVPVPGNGSRWLYIRTFPKGWIRERVDAYPTVRAKVKAALRAMLDRTQPAPLPPGDAAPEVA